MVLGMRGERALVYFHQNVVVSFGSELSFVVSAGCAAHRSHFLGVVPGPIDLCGKVTGIAGGEMQSGAPIRDHFLHYASPGRENRNGTGKGFGGNIPKGLVMTLRRPHKESRSTHQPIQSIPIKPWKELDTAPRLPRKMLHLVRKWAITSYHQWDVA